MNSAVRHIVIAGLTLFMIPFASNAEEPTPAGIEFFEKNIRPIFAETCYECHGPDEQENGLRLDSKAAFLKGGESGSLINTDSPMESRLVHVIGYTGEVKMPEDMKLADEDIQALRQWVEMGTPWPEDASTVEDKPDFSFTEFIQQTKDSHWAFQPLRSPKPPDVHATDRVSTPVDAYVLAQLENKNLMLSPEADRRTLIRRLSYDLTGLPPSNEDVQAFVDDTNPHAYKKLVEQYLAAPQYGERWGRHWLDVARYADTKGYVFEEDRFFPYSYTYRDYVVRAFNEDLPYDQFIVEQLAADKLELGDDKRPLAAMGYLTLGRRFINNIHDITDDRIDVVSRGLMGLTVSCARCHDHKFDPVPTSDYYAMYGIFRSASQPRDLPLLEEPDENDPEYQEFLTLLKEKELELSDYQHEVHIDLLIETRRKFSGYLTAAHDTLLITDDTEFKTIAKERELRHQILRPWVDFLKKIIETPDAIYRPYGWFNEIATEYFEAEAPALLERIRNATEGDERVNPKVREIFTGDPPASMTEVVERYAALFESTDQEWRDTLSAYIMIAAHTPEATPAFPTRLDDDNAEALRQQIYGTESPANIAAGRVYAISDTPLQQGVRAKQRVIARHKATHEGRPDRATSLVDAAKPFNPTIFLRGKPETPGDKVPRRFLTVLANDEPEIYTESSGRLEMARAIASPDNPLTARVFVNRVWGHHFGRALVDTPSDFGLQGSTPTHPQLLDYLASYFIEHDWSIKELHRIIVQSATYRQSSDHNELGIEADVENRLLWRQNRKRLEFEAMRDSLLAAAGKLDLTIGGPPESMTEDPVTTRRAIYGLVERQNMAGFIRTFDFASPDIHSPKRFNTIVPQQALFLMNSPFTIEQAKALAVRANGDDNATDKDRIKTLFEICYQRPPTLIELVSLTTFLNRDSFDNGPIPPQPSPWHYGYGTYNEETQTAETFTAFEQYLERRWQPLEEYPNETYGHAMLGSKIGHPGDTPEHSVIRRWIAPRAGTLELSAKLTHENEGGDGLLAHITSSRIGLIHTYTVHNTSDEAKHVGIPVEAGDIIDFIASPGTTPTYDTFEWSIKLTMARPEDSEGQSFITEWDAREDFAGPPPEPPEPLDSWGQLAQVLLLTNEFMYVD